MFKANHWQLEKEGSYVKQHSWSKKIAGYQGSSSDAYYGVTLRAIENLYQQQQTVIFRIVLAVVIAKKLQLWQTKSCKPFLKSVANATGCRVTDEVLNNGKCMDRLVDALPCMGRYFRKHEHQRSVANIGLELRVTRKEYQYLNLNDHVNKCQSTNDAYPTGFRIAVYSSD